MSDWKIQNGRNDVTVSASALAATINSAPAGSVITVAEAGSPIHLQISRSIPGYGVCVVLPPDQIVRVSFSAGSGGVQFFGGRVSGWDTSGQGVGVNGLQMEAGSSRVGFHGSHFDESYNAAVVRSASDVWLRGCRFDVQAADGFHTTKTSRIKIEGLTAGEGAMGDKICYFDDGRSPVYNISENSCTAMGGSRRDSIHNDVAQIHEQCTDVTIENCEVNSYQSQGFVSFGALIEDNLAYRVKVANNVLNNSASWGIWFRGEDIEVSDNTVSGVGPDNVSIKVEREGAGRIKGGRNVAPTVSSPSGVDLASDVINGDAGVVPPELPRINLPPWSPTVPVPTPRPPDAPQHVIAGQIEYIGSPVVGNWFTLNIGSWSGRDGATFEYKWSLDGVDIAGQTSVIYQATAAGQLRGFARGTNAYGMSDWVEFGPVAVT